MTSSVSLEQQIARLREQVRAAERRRASAEGRRDAATATVSQVEDDMRREFGVAAEEAPAKLAELESAAGAEATRVQRELGEAGSVG